jgi:hypothetical protein
MLGRDPLCVNATLVTKKLLAGNHESVRGSNSRRDYVLPSGILQACKQTRHVLPNLRVTLKRSLTSDSPSSELAPGREASRSLLAGSATFSAGTSAVAVNHDGRVAQLAEQLTLNQ